MEKLLYKIPGYNVILYKNKGLKVYFCQFSAYLFNVYLSTYNISTIKTDNNKNH